MIKKSLFFLLLFLPARGEEGLLDQIVAIVGTEVILQSELEEAVLLYKTQLPQEVKDESALRNEILEELIKEKLLLLEAKKDTLITVSDEEMEKFLELRLVTLEKEMGKDNLEAELKRENLTRDEFKNRFRKRVGDQLYIQKLLEGRLKNQLSVTPDEVKAFYEEKQDSIPLRPTMLRLSHILVLVKPSLTYEKQGFEKAFNLYQRLKGGENFEGLAYRYSDDRQTANLGGDLGYLRRMDLPSPFSDTLFALEPGEITAPLRGDFGYHIFKCQEKSEAGSRLRHIFVEVKPGKEDSLEAITRAKKVLNQLKSGGSFSELAKKLSDDQLSKGYGGDLGWIAITEFPEPFQDSLMNLETGKSAGPWDFGIGLHIFKLEDKKAGGKPSFEELQQDLTQLVYNRKLEKAMDELVQKIRERIYVEKKI